MSYRSFTATEASCAPLWDQWAMECLTDEQVSHCGHLGALELVDGCEWCAELARHVRKHPKCIEGYPGCELCHNPAHR
jgi:hypothetical protein